MCEVVRELLQELGNRQAAQAVPGFARLDHDLGLENLAGVGVEALWASGVPGPASRVPQLPQNAASGALGVWHCGQFICV